LINTCRKKRRDGLRFHPGVSYRHLLVGAMDQPRSRPSRHTTSRSASRRRTCPPARGRQVQALMEASIPFVAEHPVNQARRRPAKDRHANLLWARGGPDLKPYRELYGLTGGVISAWIDPRSGCARRLAAPKFRAQPAS
jgi:2,3-bisphosphoglycerate-independent phosphoglycerate mutase